MNRSVFRSFRTQVTPLPYPTGEFTGKTVLVTGANVGLGLEAARHFVRLKAAVVILGCRDPEKGAQAQKEIEASEAAIIESSGGKVQAWQVDLGSFDSVKAFCGRADAELDRLDVVVENAALQTAIHELYEGYERSVTVHVLSTYLMALLLLPVMRRTADKYYDAYESSPHLVIIGSNAHFYAPLHDRDEPKILDALRGDNHMIYRYYDTKLISVLLMRELAERMGSNTATKVVCNMPEPGFCQSNLTRESMFPWHVQTVLSVALRILARTSEQGSRTYLAAAQAGRQSHGMYLEDCELSTPSDFVQSEDGAKLQKKLWEELVDILEVVEPGVSGNVG